MSTTLDEAPARRGGAAWLVLGLLALVVFELTANPALAVAIGCLKFGWDELATARWLWARDPVRARGRVVSLYYAAWALWRVTGVAIALMLLVAWASEPILNAIRAQGQNVPGVAKEIGAAALVMVAAALGTVAVSILAVASAWWTGVRVWVGPEAKIARKFGRWPPATIPSHPTPNRAHWVSTSAVLSLAVPVLIAAIIVGCLAPAFVAGRLAPRLPEWAGIAVAVLLGAPAFFLFSISSAVLVLKISHAILPRIAAESPEACWSHDTAESW